MISMFWNPGDDYGDLDGHPGRRPRIELALGLGAHRQA